MMYMLSDILLRVFSSHTLKVEHVCVSIHTMDIMYELVLLLEYELVVCINPS